jgi:hypothetical protein
MALGRYAVRPAPLECREDVRPAGEPLSGFVAGPVKRKYGQVEYSFKPVFEKLFLISVFTMYQVENDAAEEEIVGLLADVDPGVPDHLAIPGFELDDDIAFPEFLDILLGPLHHPGFRFPDVLRQGS